MTASDRLRDVDRVRAVRSAVAVLIVGLLVASAASSVAYEPPSLEPGPISDPARGSTIISVQGYNIGGKTKPNKPARLVSVGPRGSLEWAVGAGVIDAEWFYDVDPLPNGDLLVVGTFPHRTRVARIDRDTRNVRWSETLPAWDTHDVTLTEDGNLLVAQMRNTENGTSNDRVFVYNRTTDEVVWQWLFRNHYPNGTAGGISDGDWTHVNDVDVIAPGLYMLSPRNFDQVIVVNRSTKEVVMRLGRDGNHDILYEQHNPSYLETESGRPAILVADSENHRVVEYTCDRGDPTHPLDGDMKPNCNWTLTWSVGQKRLEWPRDADRLPNGNTLITDTRNHRVIEVTPNGTVVWSYHAPWMPYDAERPVHGHEPSGPTMQDLNVTGSKALSWPDGTAAPTPEFESIPHRLQRSAAALPGGDGVAWLLGRYRAAAPWVMPIWLSPNARFFLSLAVLLSLAWGTAEGVRSRHRLWAGLKQLGDRLQHARESF